MKTQERARLYGRTLRELAIKALGGKCGKCGSDRGLHIHHKNHNLKDLTPENLILLCERCHGLEHNRSMVKSQSFAGPSIRTTFYIDSQIHESFKAIAIREGESVSQKIEEFMSRYVDVHDEGNPQTRLEKYGALPTHECFFCHARLSKLFRVRYVSGLVASTCQVCLEQNQAKARFSTVKKVMGVIQ